MSTRNISAEAYNLIVRHETGGRDYYELVLKGHPCWPGYSSGITIGCGYDLGYHSEEDFRDAWGAYLDDNSLTRLAAFSGFRTTNPDRDKKVKRAQQAVKQLKDIVIPWETAVAQFETGKLPETIDELDAALPNIGLLSPNSYGALLSLTFNRGVSYSNGNSRFREMVAIRRLLRDGSPDALAEIPNQIRSMRRLWGPNSALSRRREEEATLFEKGLLTT